MVVITRMFLYITSSLSEVYFHFEISLDGTDENRHTETCSITLRTKSEKSIHFISVIDGSY